MYGRCYCHWIFGGQYNRNSSTTKDHGRGEMNIIKNPGSDPTMTAAGVGKKIERCRQGWLD